ncbi:uncharacterized protein LOC102708769 [Oryza brachyantha]|uniref:uncharacterized protein LOC102708769 n=1 Tax=Oryza brachyantha TaxID=4533 RepID=UPI001ADAADC4|nr:uncharacterized protein LOC102708769 [Oryza brachyantha]
MSMNFSIQSEGGREGLVRLDWIADSIGSCPHFHFNQPKPSFFQDPNPPSLSDVIDSLGIPSIYPMFVFHRMTMSDDGDRTCPLCAEEMDITDQQLKPCKCGYEICVWCWHHIMDMAEKEDTEGRCPACRTRYDKDRIVKMAATCDRTVVEKNVDKKQKTQKVKPKAATVEAKKHLASVRVIQRNLVYIIGLPANLCNESILERREYFGQYGRVLKVSVSRTTGAPSQQASTNNSISVYITYAKEEEAIRCIQAVHNFVLEGKVLRACFGTTKYCHAWLRNMTCGNPDCLYLHDVGSQEDSFTKDEIISAYTRSRVPQMASSVSQRRSGTILPPPADDLSYSAVVAAKHTTKNGINNTANQSRLSPPNSSSGRFTLPLAASWGHRDLNTRTPTTGVSSSQSLTKSKTDPQSNSFSSSLTVSSTKLPSSWNDDTSTVQKMTEDQDSLSKTLKPYKPGIAKETQVVTSPESSLDIDFSTIPSAWNDDDVPSDVVSKGGDEKQDVNENGKLICSVSSKPTESDYLASKPSTSPKKDIAVNSTRRSPPNCVSSSAVSKSEVKDGDSDYQVTNMASKTPTLVVVKDQSNQAAIDTVIEDTRSDSTDIDGLSVGVSSVTLSRKDGVQSMAENQQLDGVLSASVVVPLSQNLRLADNEDSTCQASSDKHRDWCSDLQSSVAPPLNDTGSSAVATDKSHVRVLDATDQASSSPYVHFPNTSPFSLWNCKEISHTSTSDRTSAMMQPGLLSSNDSSSTMFNGRQEALGNIYAPGKVPEHHILRNHQPGAVNVGGVDKAVIVNEDESSIISDILSLEFDPWDESYSTANNFAKMLSASEKNNALFDAPSWKTKTCSNESRFSFARQDNQGSFLESSMRNYGSEQNFSLPSQNSNGNIYQSGISFKSPEEGFLKSNSLTMLDMLATGTSKPKVSAPPGFSVPARVPPGFSSGFSSQEGLNPPPGFSSHNGPNPPPGFSSQGGSNQVYGSAYSETRPFDDILGINTSHYQPQLSRQSSDIEFIDPAILAVGKGRMPGISDSGLEMKTSPTFPAQLQTSNDPRLQLLMQQNMPSHQNLGFADHIQDAFNPMNDNYLASRLIPQNHGSLSSYAHMSLQQPRSSHLTNGHWDSWGDLRQGNNVSMPDMSRILYPTEANNFHMLGSNDLYNRAFGL